MTAGKVKQVMPFLRSILFWRKLCYNEQNKSICLEKKDGKQGPMELQEILAALWAEKPYKLILSNPYQKQFAYHKMVWNHLDQGWQVEKYTQKQVFHENLSEEEGNRFFMETMSVNYKQCNAWTND